MLVDNVRYQICISDYFVCFTYCKEVIERKEEVKNERPKRISVEREKQGVGS